MNNIELHALRRLLFFTQPEFAILVSGTSERAVKHWEAGARPVPEDVANRVRELLQSRQNYLHHFINSPYKSIVFYSRIQDFPDSPVLWRPHQSACAAACAIDPSITLDIATARE